MQNSNLTQSLIQTQSYRSMQPVNEVAPAFSELSDRELYKKCQEIGALTLKYRKQFLGMIPEVEKRKLYLRHGMHGIYEFAAKLAGVSREVVNEVLRIHRLLNDAPMLQEKLISGEVSYTKLRPVATVATKENQEIWLRKVETMSRPTLEVYVRDVKRQEAARVEGNTGGENGIEGQMVKNEQRMGRTDEHAIGRTNIQTVKNEHRTEQAEKYVIQNEQLTGMFPVSCGLPWKEQEYETLSMKVNSRTAAKMRVFKLRLERKLRKPLNWDETLREILILAEAGTGQKTRKAKRKLGEAAAEVKVGKKMERGLSTAKTQLAQYGCSQNKALKNTVSIEKTKRPAKHRAPVAIQHQVLEENQGICDSPGCNKPGEIFHHTERFSLKPEHNPEKIKYLCKPHERIAHHSLIKNEEQSPENWQLLLEPDKNHPKYFVDSLVQKFRIGIA